MDDIQALQAEAAELDAEIDGILAQTATLKSQREDKQQQMYALKNEVRGLTGQIDAIEQPRLAEAKNRRAVVARALQAVRSARKPV